MRTTPFALLVAVVIVLSFACGESAPPPEPAAEPEAANPNDQFAGAWTLVRSERRDADGELIGEPREDRVGYIMYDPSGYMGVTLMSNDREPYSEGGPRPEEALAQMGSYASYFGAVHRQRGGGVRDPPSRGEPEPGRRRLRLPAVLHHRRGYAEAPAAGQRGRLALVHHLAAPARSARIGADRHAPAAFRRLPRRVGDPADHGRRAGRRRSVPRRHTSCTRRRDTCPCT